MALTTGKSTDRLAPALQRTFASQRPPNVGPASDSADEAAIKGSRTTDDAQGSERGGSTAQPVMGKGDQVGDSEEGQAPEKSGAVGRDSEPLDEADRK